MKPSDPGLAQNLSISHNCPDYVQCLCLGQGQAIKSGFCPELVLVQYLSSQCPRSVSGRWEPNQSGIKYRFCPESVQSKICPENVQHQRLLIPRLLYQTICGQILDLLFQYLSKDHCLGQDLYISQTATGQTLYNFHHWTDPGQNTDRYWTTAGFYVQGLSNRCPTTHC